MPRILCRLYTQGKKVTRTSSGHSYMLLNRRRIYLFELCVVFTVVDPILGPQSLFHTNWPEP